jgi:hypothetical protein
MATDINNRGQKSVEVASTYIQVLITLSSAIIAAVLGFYPTLLDIPQFNFFFLKIALMFFGASIIGGLVGLGALISKISSDSIPAQATMVNLPVAFQFILFGLGIFVMLFVIP